MFFNIFVCVGVMIVIILIFFFVKKLFLFVFKFDFDIFCFILNGFYCVFVFIFFGIMFKNNVNNFGCNVLFDWIEKFSLFGLYVINVNNVIICLM